MDKSLPAQVVHALIKANGDKIFQMLYSLYSDCIHSNCSADIMICNDFLLNLKQMLNSLSKRWQLKK